MRTHAGVSLAALRGAERRIPGLPKGSLLEKAMYLVMLGAAVGVFFAATAKIATSEPVTQVKFVTREKFPFPALYFCHSWTTSMTGVGGMADGIDDAGKKVGEFSGIYSEWLPDAAKRAQRKKDLGFDEACLGGWCRSVENQDPVGEVCNGLRSANGECYAFDAIHGGVDQDGKVWYHAAFATGT